MRVRWLGAAGFELVYGKHALLIDPYVTRAPLHACLLRPLRTDPTAVARFAPRADAVLVSHTHFDHVADVPAIAHWTGAPVWGSNSAAALCRAQAVPDRLVREVCPGMDALEVGPFRIRVIASEHSPLLARRVPFDGQLEPQALQPLRASSYRCGEMLAFSIEVAGRRIAHLGSAQLVDDAWDGAFHDLVLLCAAGWKSTPKFAARVLRATRPRAVLLSHWDQFWRPLDRRVRALPGVRVHALAKRLQSLDKALAVGTLPLLGTIHI